MDSNNRKKARTGASISLLATGSRLKSFTVSELAEHAGASLDAARSFLRRSADFELVSIQNGTGRGRPQKRWQLRPQRENSVLTQLAEVSRIVDGSRTQERLDRSPTTLELLNLTLLALENAEIRNVQERRQEIELAKLYLAAADAEIKDRDAARLPIETGAHEAITRARRRIALLRADRFTPAAPLTLPLPVGFQDNFADFLRDWTVQIKVPQLPREVAGNQIAEYGINSLLEDALRASAQRPNDAASVLIPSAILARYKSAWNPEIQKEFGEALCEKISKPAMAQDPFMFSSLAVAAAVFHAVEVAESLFKEWLSPQVIAHKTGDLRDICALSLARLAAPGSQPKSNDMGAAACSYLLARMDPGDTAEPIFAIAAMMASNSDASSMLHRIGSMLFENNSLKEVWRDRLGEGALMRNLALSLHSADFEALQKAIESLVERASYGVALIASLRSPVHQALDLTDTNKDNEFEVRAGLRVAQSLALPVRHPVPLKVNEETTKKLSEIISQQMWSEASPALQHAGRQLWLIGGGRRAG